MESGRDLEKEGVGQAPPAASRGWLEGGIPREASATYEDAAHGATLYCALSEPGVQWGLLCSGSVSTCQHKTSLCPSKTCLRAFMAAQS